MTWNTLPEAPALDWYAADLKAEHAAIETERQAISEERAAIDAAQRKLESADVADALANGDGFRQRVAACLQRELAWRERFDAFLAAVLAAGGGESSAAAEALQSVEAQVIAWLEKGAKKDLSGYLTPVEGEQIVGSWTREMVLRHPAVLAARMRCNDALPLWANDLRGANHSGGESTLVKLQKLKNQALAV